MALIVQKFGGTSVADTQRIRHVATRVLKTHERGNDVVVILSAMAGMTDRYFLEQCPEADRQALLDTYRDIF